MTAKKLREEIRNYFAEISRTVELKESVCTGEKDEKGKDIYVWVTALNGRGEPVLVEEWLVPPTIADLLGRLHLTAQRWAQIKAEGGLAGAVAMAAEAKVERYLRRELLTRPGKDLKGVILMLQNDFGFGGEVEEQERGTLEELLGESGA